MREGEEGRAVLGRHGYAGVLLLGETLLSVGREETKEVWKCNGANQTKSSNNTSQSWIVMPQEGALQGENHGHLTLSSDSVLS